MKKKISIFTSGFLALLAFCSVSKGETVVSEIHPVQVHYEGSQHHSFAEAILNILEESWNYQVHELGFPPPPIGPDSCGGESGDNYNVFVESTMWGAFIEPTFPALDRPFGYCSKMVVDPGIPVAALGILVSHEFHHAVQYGVRLIGRNIAEAGAVYISGLQRTGEGWMLSYYLGFNAFQAHPERSLDWQAGPGDFYPYGGALYLMYLDQVHGQGPDGYFVKSIFDLLGHEDYPHYFDAIAELVDFDDTYKEFTRYRYFVGPKDDGYHLKDLSNWEGSYPDEKLNSVSLAFEHNASDLPIINASPEISPMPYGASYTLVRLNGLDPEDKLGIALTGDPSTRWSLQTILQTKNERPLAQSKDADESGIAYIEFTKGQADKLIVAFVNLGPEEYVPDGGNWNPADFTFSILQVHPAPTVDSIEPDRLVRRTQANQVLIHGSGFVDGQELHVGFGDQNITAEIEEFISSEELQVLVTVSGSAEPGPRDVIVTNPGGNWGIGENLLTITEQENGDDAGPEQSENGSEKGCGCRNVHKGEKPTFLFIFIFLLGIFLLCRNKSYSE